MKALGDQNRFRISMMLLSRPLCVCELLEVLDIAGGTLSNHLKILKNAELIDQRKDGKWVEYFIANESAKDLLNSLADRVTADDLIKADRQKICVITRAICSSRSQKRTNLKAVKGFNT